MRSLIKAEVNHTSVARLVPEGLIWLEVSHDFAQRYDLRGMSFSGSVLLASLMVLGDVLLEMSVCNQLALADEVIVNEMPHILMVVTILGCIPFFNKYF